MFVCLGDVVVVVVVLFFCVYPGTVCRRCRPPVRTTPPSINASAPDRFDVEFASLHRRESYSPTTETTLRELNQTK